MMSFRFISMWSVKCFVHEIMSTEMPTIITHKTNVVILFNVVLNIHKIRTYLLEILNHHNHCTYLGIPRFPFYSQLYENRLTYSYLYNCYDFHFYYVRLYINNKWFVCIDTSYLNIINAKFIVCNRGYAICLSIFTFMIIILSYCTWTSLIHNLFICRLHNKFKWITKI